MSPAPSNFKIEPASLFRRWRNTAIVLFMLAMLFLLSPILIPISIYNTSSLRRRIGRAARAFRCPRCGEPVGDAGLKLAAKHWQADLDEYRRKNPGVKFNFHRPYDAVCPSCETRYAYRLNPPSFEPVSGTI